MGELFLNPHKLNHGELNFFSNKGILFIHLPGRRGRKTGIIATEAVFKVIPVSWNMTR